MNLPTGYTACPRCDRAYRTRDGHKCGKAARRPVVRPHDPKPERAMLAVPVRVPTPNATETRILNALAEMTGTQPHDWEFEGYEMTLGNGHSYTPDWIHRARRIVVECKGTYSHGSRQRSRLAFHQAWAEYREEWSFVWAQEVDAKRGCPKHIKLEMYK